MGTALRSKILKLKIYFLKKACFIISKKQNNEISKMFI